MNSGSVVGVDSRRTLATKRSTRVAFEYSERNFGLFEALCQTQTAQSGADDGGHLFHLYGSSYIIFGTQAEKCEKLVSSCYRSYTKCLYL